MTKKVATNSKRFQNRLEQRADNFADKEIRPLSEALTRHMGHVGIAQTQADELICLERDRIRTEFIERRASGDTQDLYSLGLGFTLFFKEEFRKILEDIQKDRAELREYPISEIGKVDDSPVFKMHIPGGIYGFDVDWDGSLLYLETEAVLGDDGYPRPVSSRIRIDDYGALFRIEGDSGELCQNPRYLPDGHDTYID